MLLQGLTEVDPARRCRSESEIVYTNTIPTSIQRRSMSVDTGIPNEATATASSPNSHGRCVKFGNAINVVLIPTREEYRQASLDKGIWWRKSELKTFKEDAVEELKIVMLGSKLDLPHARAVLYQPMSSVIRQWKSKYGQAENDIYKIDDSILPTDTQIIGQ